MNYEFFNLYELFSICLFKIKYENNNGRVMYRSQINKMILLIIIIMYKDKDQKIFSPISYKKCPNFSKKGQSTTERPLIKDIYKTVYNIKSL